MRLGRELRQRLGRRRRTIGLTVGRRRMSWDGCSRARASNNKRQGICGALLVSDHWFVQVLEGAEGKVRALFAHIESDPRHDSVSVLQNGSVTAKVFARWAMAEMSDDGEPDIPLIAHADGISPASSRGTTPTQDEVLETMRAAARDEAQRV